MKILVVLLFALLVVTSAVKESKNVKGNGQPNLILFLVDDVSFIESIVCVCPYYYIIKL